MKAHKFSSTTKVNSFQLKDFLGVDFTTHESEVNVKRSPEAINMISGKSGSIDKRFGYELYPIGFSGKIWAMKTVKTYVYEPITLARIEIEVLIVHSGTALYAYNPYLDTWQPADAYTPSGFLSAGTYTIQERKTNFIDYNNQSYLTIIQNNWITDRNDLLVMYCSANTLAGHEGEISFYLVVNDAWNQHVYLPTTSIGRSPNGLTSTDYESENLMINVRKNSFLSNATDKTFILDYIGNTYRYNAYVLHITQMQSDGSFSDNLHDASGNPITVTFNATAHSFTFSSVPHETYKTGADNIKITFRTGTDTIKITSNINDYQSYGTYGLSGSNDVLFACNHYEQRFRNKEIWFRFMDDDNDSTNISLLYLEKNNYSYLGSNRKIGYSKVGEYFILHGEREASSPVAYLKTINLDSSGELYVSNRPTTSQIGAIAKDTFSNLRDDPLFVSESGVTAVVIDSITGIQSMQDRGFYINELLLKESNLENAMSIVFDNKYFLFVGEHIYIADPRNKYTERLSYSEQFQYEWYYWLFPIDITCLEIYDGTLYFGSPSGRIYKLKNENSTSPYTDESLDSNHYKAGWVNTTNYVIGDVVLRQVESIYYDFYCIQDNINVEPTNEYYWINIGVHSSSLDDVRIPVYAYWTTPIMNMGNITMLKTLKNLWVRLGKYAHMSTRIYYSTKGLIKEEYDGVFDFSDIDFSRFVFSSDTDPSVMVTNRTERKFMSIQFKVESRTADPFSLLEIVGKYITNSQYKGR